MSCDSTNKRSTHRLKRADKTRTSNKYINKSIIIKQGCRAQITVHLSDKMSESCSYVKPSIYSLSYTPCDLPFSLFLLLSVITGPSLSAYIMQDHAIVLRKDVLVRHVSENDTACNSVFFLSIFLLKLSYRSQAAICDKAAAATEKTEKLTQLIWANDQNFLFHVVSRRIKKNVLKLQSSCNANRKYCNKRSSLLRSDGRPCLMAFILLKCRL